MNIRGASWKGAVAALGLLFLACGREGRSAPAEGTAGFIEVMGPGRIVRGRPAGFSFRYTGSQVAQLRFKVRWGDGDEWMSPVVNAGQPAEMTHTYATAGERLMQVYVYDAVWDQWYDYELVVITVHASGSKTVLDGGEKVLLSD